MDNNNQSQLSKCGSTWQSSAEERPVVVVVPPSSVSQVQSLDSSRNSMMNQSHYSYQHIGQEPCSSTRKMMADPMFQTTNTNLYNSVMGNSFFTLLSGSPSFSQYEALSSKPSSKAHVYNSSVIVNPTEHEASFGSHKLSTQNIDNRYLKSNIDTCPVVPSGNTASCLHDIVQPRKVKVSDPSIELTEAANYHNSNGIEQPNGFSSLKATQISGQTSGLPRVFCLYASGDLFLTSSGLLGVICFCHGFRMSISKFSEHSGLRDVNPGDAVHMDSGETIAQWRKVYFSKFGIRISEDQSGWNWPEGFSISTAVDLVNRSERVPNVSKTSHFSNTVAPSTPFVAASKQPFNYTVFQNNNRSSQNLVKHNGFTETCKSNVHGEEANKIGSGCISMSKLNAFQSIDPIYKNRTLFNTQKSLQDLSQRSDIVEKAMVSSNIELRLGQPSQQSQPLGKSSVPGSNTPCISRVGNPMELISSQPLFYNGNNKITGENKQFVNCAAEAAKSSSTKAQNRLEFSNLGFGAYSRINRPPQQSKGELVGSSVNAMLFSHFGNQKDKLQTKDSADDCQIIPKQQYFASRIPKLDSTNFGCNTNDSTKVLFSSSFGFNKSSCEQSSRGQIPINTLVDVTMKNSSPKFTSTMSKGDVNPHTPSSRQIPSTCNEILRSSITLPSKSSETDAYKLASRYNVQELATKCVHSGTNPWTAVTAEKSAVVSVSREASFQIRDIGVQSNLLLDSYQNISPLPRIGAKENICSSSVHRDCCQGTYIQEKCSCWVQRNSIIRTSNLEEKQFVGAFGEQSQINASNLEKSCTLHVRRPISSDKIGETMKPNLKKVEFNAFQWKDVPSKDPTTKFLAEQIDVNECQQTVSKADCMKEQVMSNISSKCSAPALTQASVKISNGDSCTDDAKNFAVDESSGIQKSWSSDDSGCAHYINSKNDTNEIQISNRKTRSLIDELRVIDSLRLKKPKNQEYTSSMKGFEARKRKRETTFNVSSVSAGSSGQSSQYLEERPRNYNACSVGYKLDKSKKEALCKTQRRVYDDFLETPESSSRGKKVTRVDLEFSKPKKVWKPEMLCRKVTKPIVCGRYGIISNGDTSKPAKIFSLGKILKSAKRCELDAKEVVKKSPAKTWRKSIIKEAKRRSAFIDDDLMETSEDTDKSYTLEKKQRHRNIEYERSYGIQDGGLGSKTKRKKRSLYELITEGNDCGFATTSKNIASVSRDNLNDGRNSNNLHGGDNIHRSHEESTCKSTPDVDTFCHVCRSLKNDEMNNLLECHRCFIKVHQACYGISKVPKSYWYCRPCRENATNMACVLCGYEGGVMTRAVQSSNIVKSLLIAWNIDTESQENAIMHSRMSKDELNGGDTNTIVVNSVTAGVFDSTLKQWVHMVCGLWTPGTRCPNVDTMSAFDVSGATCPKGNVVCSMCKRGGGCCIRCRVIDCSIHFHPWCAHQKGLLQSEVEGTDNDKVGFYGRCELHATQQQFIHTTNNDSQTIQLVNLDEKETCARTEGYKGRKREGFRHDNRQSSSGCLVRQEQVDAWNHINRQLLFKKRLQRTQQPVQDVEYDFRKEYTRYKQSKGWKHLVVYKSGIHALGLYTSFFISQSAMVVEYVGEIVGLRVADRREMEYQSGKQLQYKSACYFFKIDKEHIIDATRKGGIARFVNHSCQPNCVAKVITVRGEKKVVFFAERDIYPGEEITYDYHFNNEDEAKKILCSCNSNNCRRYLN